MKLKIDQVDFWIGSKNAHCRYVQQVLERRQPFHGRVIRVQYYLQKKLNPNHHSYYRNRPQPLASCRSMQGGIHRMEEQ
jgi:hypothetical protein